MSVHDGRVYARIGKRVDLANSMKRHRLESIQPWPHDIIKCATISRWGILLRCSGFSVHCIQSSLQFFFQPHIRGRSLLGSRIFMRPFGCVIWDGDVGLIWIDWPSHLSLRLLYADVLSKSMYLSKNHLTHFWHFFYNLKVEIKTRWARWLIGRIMPNVQVSMLQSFLNRYSRRRVECQHSVQKVQCIRIRIREKTLKGNLGHEW